jgi:hypothetical protein
VAHPGFPMLWSSLHDHEVADLEAQGWTAQIRWELLQRWWQQRQACPGLLTVDWELTDAGPALWVDLYPWPARGPVDHPLLTTVPQRSPAPICLLGGMVVGETQAWLEEAVAEVVAQRELDGLGAIAFMAQAMLWELEIGQWFAYRKFLLERWEEALQDGRAASDPRGPAWSLANWRRFWTVAGPRLLTRSWFSEDDWRLGWISYKAVPPVWISSYRRGGLVLETEPGLNWATDHGTADLIEMRTPTPSASELVLGKWLDQWEPPLAADLWTPNPAVAACVPYAQPHFEELAAALQGRSYRPRPSQLPAGAPTSAPALAISSETEDAEFVRWRFKSRLPLRITGWEEEKATNVVEVDGQSVRLDAADFVFLYQLVVALLEREDGWIPLKELRFDWTDPDARAPVEHHLDQRLGRLRKPFKDRFAPIQHTDLIEGRNRRVRLSTHWRYVSWDTEVLRHHSHPGIRILTERLVAAAERRLQGTEPTE